MLSPYSAQLKHNETQQHAHIQEQEHSEAQTQGTSIRIIQAYSQGQNTQHAYAKHTQSYLIMTHRTTALSPIQSRPSCKISISQAADVQHTTTYLSICLLVQSSPSGLWIALNPGGIASRTFTEHRRSLLVAGTRKPPRKIIEQVTPTSPKQVYSYFYI